MMRNYYIISGVTDESVQRQKAADYANIPGNEVRVHTHKRGALCEDTCEGFEERKDDN